MPTDVAVVAPDRLRDLLDTIIGALDEDLDGGALASRAYLSRFHFDRLVTSGLGEAPATLRRRLLLERAAWALSHGTSVTEAGIDAGYGSTEAFSRAFSRAFGTPPSRHRAGGFRLAAPNGVHFHPPAGLRVPGTDRRLDTMDLTDRLLEHDQWLTTRLMEHAGELTDDQLDREIRPGHQVLSFDGPEPSVRLMLERLAWTKEVWTAAIAGRAFSARGESSVAALRARFEAAGEEFLELARGIRDRGEWDDAFVDALCEPPQSFSLGSVIAHVVTFSAHRRQVLAGALQELGVEGSESLDPIDWEQRLVGEGA